MPQESVFFPSFLPRLDAGIKKKTHFEDVVWHHIAMFIYSITREPEYFLCVSLLTSFISFVSLLFFPLFLINFYWSIAALQCCTSLYCTAK